MGFDWRVNHPLKPHLTILKGSDLEPQQSSFSQAFFHLS